MLAASTCSPSVAKPKEGDFGEWPMLTRSLRPVWVAKPETGHAAGTSSTVFMRIHDSIEAAVKIE
eukprot:1178060-Pyramimonas_sp.AAC.1